MERSCCGAGREPVDGDRYGCLIEDEAREIIAWAGSVFGHHDVPYCQVVISLNVIGRTTTRKHALGRQQFTANTRNSSPMPE
ncbi:hypothetical protein Pst134EB_014522 [Puccinia striiformis f. sp. tritici]|nr:hypothetical protein Pst134EB_014522 [Puccinia striiformis f. sp. tritici]